MSQLQIQLQKSLQLKHQQLFVHHQIHQHIHFIQLHLTDLTNQKLNNSNNKKRQIFSYIFFPLIPLRFLPSHLFLYKIHSKCIHSLSCVLCIKNLEKNKKRQYVLCDDIKDQIRKLYYDRFSFLFFFFPIE